MQSKTNTETAVNAAELSADEILILRDTDEAAGAVAHLAAARLYALMTSDAEEPGVDFGWFDRAGIFAAEGADVSSAAAAHITGLASYVRTRQVQSAEQLYLHSGGRNWHGESAPYCQALDLFRVTVLSAASGMETRRAALNDADAYARQAAAFVPLKLEDSIFEPEESMGTMLPHALQALKDGAKAMAAKLTGKPEKDAAPLSVGEPPAGHAKAKSTAKQHNGKKQN